MRAYDPSTLAQIFTRGGPGTGRRVALTTSGLGHGIARNGLVRLGERHCRREFDQPPGPGSTTTTNCFAVGSLWSACNPAGEMRSAAVKMWRYSATFAHVHASAAIPGIAGQPRT